MSIEATRVRFVADDLSFEIPADQLEVTWDASIDRINFAYAPNPEICIATYDDQVLEHPALPQVRALREEVHSTRNRRELNWRLKLTIGVIAACIIITIGCSWGMSFMVRAIAARIPPDLERKFGEAALVELGFDASGPTLTNEAAQVAALARPLLAVIPGLKQEVKFYVLENEDPNAFALPGGLIVVHTGLLQIVDRPEELQGVLAHELAHLTERHVFRQVISSAGPLLILSVFVNSGSGGSLLAMGSGIVISQGFSKEYETEADEIGWNYLLAANIDPRGMISTFEKFQDQYEGMEMPEALSSHPLLEKRIARLRRKWSSLDNKEGFLVQPNPFARSAARKHQHY